jgi:hypothetical protein
MEGLEDFRDLTGNKINDFINEYRDTMKQNYDFNVSAIENQRNNDYQSIMSQANKRGMMYSNFPERAKIQYDADTYLPNLKNAYTSYQTGLDKLRSSALSAYNNIKETQAQIDHINKLKKTSDESNKSSGMDIKWGKVGTKNGGIWYYDNDGNPVRMSTWLRNNGYADSTEGYLEGAKALNSAGYLSDNDYNALVEESKNKQLIYNANGFGNKYEEQMYDGMDAGRQSLINSLGLRIQ